MSSEKHQLRREIDQVFDNSSEFHLPENISLFADYCERAAHQVAHEFSVNNRIRLMEKWLEKAEVELGDEKVFNAHLLGSVGCFDDGRNAGLEEAAAIAERLITEGGDVVVLLIRAILSRRREKSTPKGGEKE